jgi:hypothetical protein
MHFIDAQGRDIGGTEAVEGYFIRDYFSSNVSELLAEADCVETAEQWIRSAYRGPDHDGIGVAWTVLDVPPEEA